MVIRSRVVHRANSLQSRIDDPPEILGGALKSQNGDGNASRCRGFAQRSDLRDWGSPPKASGSLCNGSNPCEPASSLRAAIERGDKLPADWSGCLSWERASASLAIFSNSARAVALASDREREAQGVCLAKRVRSIVAVLGAGSRDMSLKGGACQQ
jgi:hypothetical protein